MLAAVSSLAVTTAPRYTVVIIGIYIFDHHV